MPRGKAPAGRDVSLCDAALARAFGFLGKRWNGMILAALGNGPIGFADLRRGVPGITDSMLSDRLNELSAAGLVQRCVTDTRPPGTSYGLSAAGRALVPVLDQLAVWAGRNLPEERCKGA